MVDYENSGFFKAGEERKVKVTVTNSHTMRQQQEVRDYGLYAVRRGTEKRKGPLRSPE